MEEPAIGRRSTGFPAHIRKADGAEQSVAIHCTDVARLAETNAAPLRLPNAAYLLGLLHDWGKACLLFLNYLRSAAGLLDQDSEDYVRARRLQGKIDHSTAAAQWLWEQRSVHGSRATIPLQALVLCLVSHHSGLIDCLAPAGEDRFSRRMNKPKTESHLGEVLTNLPEMVAEAEARLLPAIKELYLRFAAISKQHEERKASGLAYFDHGLLVRILFSCLIDADRFDSAAFGDPSLRELRSNRVPDWELLIARMETALGSFPADTPINRLRRQISDHCRIRGDDEQGIFTLTVPTGGGKTYGGLRFALHHARKHCLRRIIHMIPYTSIIEQNAQAAREVLEIQDDAGRIVLEHHSNLEPERDTWISKHHGETWDAPVIYTTTVQFLEAVFGAGTRGARRLHRLSNAVIVFDEVQTIPICCVHLICNAINFLVRECGSSVVLSTATQPLLTAVDATKGCIQAPREIMENLDDLFHSLERVEVINHASGSRVMPLAEIAALALKESHRFGNGLIVVNTKKSAMELYLALKKARPREVFHLSTDMCAAHRAATLNVIKKRLVEKQPTLCISTQLIEAGVDIDFHVVIRFLAGLDSIVQAAGRCNRGGSPEKGRVHIVAPELENLSCLPDIARGRQAAARVLRDFADDPASLGGSLLHPRALERYFKYAFHDRRKEMDYPVTAARFGRDDTLLEVFSANHRNVGNMQFPAMLRQSFMSAASVFQPIDAPTEGIIVPHGQGRDIIAELQADISSDRRRELLRCAQRFTVGLFPHRMRDLMGRGALQKIWGEYIFALDERYYSQEFGLSDEPIKD